MASLKEIKIRLASIRSTQKITAAMKMVASAKLHRTQAQAEHTLAYAGKLSAILDGLLAANRELESPYTEQREVRTIALVACSSGSGLCGAFNANIWRDLAAKLRSYKGQGIAVRLYPVGKRVAEELRKAGYSFDARFLTVGEKPTYESAVSLADHLREIFMNGEVDRVEWLYHHFKSTAVQVVTGKVYLPLTLSEVEAGEADHLTTDYILEPSLPSLRGLLFPKLLNLMVYTTLLDTSTAEHAARMMAMQTANDNANDLIQELTLQYNKTRQQAITNELLDIMGGETASS